MEIRAAELTADHLGRAVKIGHGDQSFITGRLLEIRHQQIGETTGLETETRLEIEVLGDQSVRVGFNSIGVIELL
jgi:hypothetical protein